MIRVILFFVFTNLFVCIYAQPGGNKHPVAANRVMLPNGWSLTPVGHSLPLGDLPLNMAVSSSGRYIAVTNNGQSTQSLQLVDTKNERILDSVDIPKSWLGLKFSADEKFLYASGGNDNWILKYAIIHSKLVLTDSIPLGKKWPEKISPAGMDIDDKRQLLYVVTKENNSLYIVNLQTKSVIQRVALGGEGYTCILSNDKEELYISCWGCEKLLVFDTEDRKFLEEIPVGDNPNDICITKDNRFLFVANSNDNSVSVIDIENRVVRETLNAALYPHSPDGSTTNAVALSRDDKTLYVANADNNCLAVFDVSQPGSSKSKGFIPVGWYPTSVKIIGKKIFVTNGKGFSSMANPYGPNPVKPNQRVNFKAGDENRPKEVQYIAGLFKGTLSIFDEPDENLLADYSALVYQNTPYTKLKEKETQGEPGNPIPMKTGAPSVIKHVFYIIKENRTYDQVLGDVREGNGDTSLVLFGEHITPNEHALVKQFVLLDNFYCDGEVSADGHNWSTAAYANDYTEKNWPTSYGKRGGSYDFGGGRKIAFPKNGFLWDQCLRHNVSLRNYGEFADEGKPPLPSLAKYTMPGYPGWNLSIQDIAREKIWEQDFDSLVKETQLPFLNIVYLPNDHTSGLSKDAYTPFAHVADNDLAVGRLVEHLSESPVWKESVVFILEDDAQNGPDHVDAHRSTAYIAGGYVKRHFVDHSMYSTSSLLRTIELIAGIPPMSQYDAAATPMWNCFTSIPDTSAFHSLPANVDINERNVAINILSAESAKFDFTREDRVPENAFNAVLWKAIKGLDAIVPVPRRAAFLKSANKEKDTD
jgi:YVTN family beta-propeller protein